MMKRVSMRRCLALAAFFATMGAAVLPAAAQDCEVKFGAAGPMSGGGAAWGLAIKGGVEFEAAWHNAAGGLQVGDRKCRVSVVSYDTPPNAAGGAAASSYFASQGVKLIVGPVSGPENAGFRPVSKRNGQLFFTTTFALDGIGPDFPLAFQCQLPPQAWGTSALKVAKDRFGIKKLLLVAPNDQGGTDAGNALLKYYGEVGVQGSPEWYQRGTINFGPIATRIMAAAPDAIETGPMPPGEASTLVRQLLEAGFKGVVGRMGTGAEQIIKGVGGADKVGTLFWYEAVPTEEAGIEKMNSDFARLVKGPMPENSLVYNAQLAAEQITRAITRAGTADDIEKIATALRAEPPESRYLGKGAWRGKTMYKSNQQLAFPIGMGFIVDGKKQPQQRVEVPGE